MEFVYQGFLEPANNNNNNTFREEIKENEQPKRSKNFENLKPVLNEGKAIPLAQGVVFNP